MTEFQHTPLFMTVVGSHMWGMERPDSDIDRFYCYQEPTRKILMGYRINETLPSKKEVENTGIGELPIETSSMEIGHLVGLLIKGNVNALWNVTSPRSIYDSYGYLEELKKITLDNLSAESYMSIHGMAISQRLDIIKRPRRISPEKAKKSCMRVLQFGITLLRDGKVEYKPVTEVPTEKELEDAFRLLEICHEETSLPTDVNTEPFREWLYNLRIRGIEHA